MQTNRLSESELSRRTGIGQPVIHRMLSGETTNPKLETVLPIASYFTLTVNQLVGAEPLPKNKIPTQISSKIPSWIQVPLLTWEQATQWPKISTDEIERYISTDIDISDNGFALMIKDSTMMPRFPEGTLVIIDPSFKPTDREFAVVHINGQKQVTFKQILIDGETVYLKPLNSDFSVIPLEKGHHFLGVMVQARIDYNPAQNRRETEKQ
jgi:SOS-response transcriptional repressor LexA